jgi:hypothetical protein
MQCLWKPTRAVGGVRLGLAPECMTSLQEALVDQVEEILGSIEIGPEVLEALVADCETLLQEKRSELAPGLSAAESELSSLKAKEKKLLDGYLEGVVPAEAYRAKVDQLSVERGGFEQSLSALSKGARDTTAQVEALASAAASARLRFAQADTLGKRKVLKTVLLNAKVEDSSIVSYQLKRPFEYLRRDPEGAFHFQWWAIEDLNL